MVQNSPATGLPGTPSPETHLPLNLPQPDAPVSLEAGQDPLAQLRDIHLPADVPFWPPAPGWFMLAALVVLLLLFKLWREWRWRRTLAYKALKALEADTTGKDSHATAIAIATLMRRILVSRGWRDEAAFTGATWEGFLGAGKAGLAPDLAHLVAEAPYRPPVSGPDPADPTDAALRARLLKAAQRWMRSNA